MRFVLASASPRRRQLLSSLVPSFEVHPSRFAEESGGRSARETALFNACGKAREAAVRYADCAVLGADTVVSLEGSILGKPSSAAHAAAMLRALSAHTHTVCTGLCLIAGGREYCDAVETRVTFAALSEALIERYVQSGMPMDKAGAYGIQDGYPLVARYEGSYSNVVGLPLERLGAMLREARLP